MTYLIASLLKSRISNFKSIIRVRRTDPFLFIVLRFYHTHIATPTIFLLSPGQISAWIRPWSERVALKTRNRLLRIGTWNIRKLYQAGKLNNALKEMDNMKLDLLGISECKWIDNGTLVKDDHSMIYSGGKEHKNGLGIIMRKEIARSLMGYWAISEIVIMIKLQGKPFNISIVQFMLQHKIMKTKK